MPSYVTIQLIRWQECPVKVEASTTYINDSIDELGDAEALVDLVLAALRRENLIELEGTLAGRDAPAAGRILLSQATLVATRRINPTIETKRER